MKWVEYKLENGEVIKAPYNRLDVAPISKNCLEELINAVNASMRQAKILEHIKTNYAYKMREQYDKGKADAIKEYKQSEEYIKECVQRYLKGRADIQSELMTEVAMLNETKMTEGDLKCFAYRIKAIAEKLKEQNNL